MNWYIKFIKPIMLVQPIFLVLGLWLITPASVWAQPETTRPAPKILFPAPGLVASDIAVIVNSSDPDSVEIGAYYQKKRGIPAENILTASFPTNKSTMPVKTFQRIKARIDAQTPTQVQAYVLTWTTPYLVGCMSITSAFALGFDPAYCAKGCKPTKPQPYFNSNSHRPFHDFAIRPTMSLAGKNTDEIKALIDRGITADGTAPTGTGYLVKTNDRARSVRSIDYASTISALKPRINLQQIHAQSLSHKQDVLFYFTGSKHVPDLDTNRFLPGAIADHLTSSGGNLIGNNSQMSILRWLEAGATASYGTVVEPCNFLQKFPHPAIVIDRYTQGESLIEAYWKSVAMPGQGIFVGEPLANPFGGYQMENKGRDIIVRTRAFRQGYMVQCADAPVVPLHPILLPARHTMRNGTLEIRFPNPGLPYCKLIPKQ